jgi:hypothetical protein
MAAAYRNSVGVQAGRGSMFRPRLFLRGCECAAHAGASRGARVAATKDSPREADGKRQRENDQSRLGDGQHDGDRGLRRVRPNSGDRSELTWLRCTRGHVSVGECHRRAFTLERAAEISDKLHQLIGIHFLTGFFGQIRLMSGHLEPPFVGSVRERPQVTRGAKIVSEL